MPISQTEVCVLSLPGTRRWIPQDDNVTLRTWHPQETNEPPVRTRIMPHHEVLLRLDAMDLDWGAKTSFTEDRGCARIFIFSGRFILPKSDKKIQPPFMMNKNQMAKTTQLDQFNEELYKVIGSDDEKYFIATSERPISAFHSEEWFEQPDFEKIEQFLVTDPTKSWEMFDTMVANSKAFYQSLGLRYRVVSVVSGALNLLIVQMYDLEAWFPFQKNYRELVSCSDCTVYQSRRLKVRCGNKTKDQTRKVYDHMLNGTLPVRFAVS
ncbi:Serine-tRNA ligase [Mycena sanguinolenta]|uniref:Seryl-tRNA(Ser) synthetase n=1 Tax=Mycena sanguinolenta TaxID=230812 RepID=A0A8H6YZI1_9AGAR|nr:Serine-tRNA ligase [Mycena sanguinolenta]